MGRSVFRPGTGDRGITNRNQATKAACEGTTLQLELYVIITYFIEIRHGHAPLLRCDCLDRCIHSTYYVVDCIVQVHTNFQEFLSSYFCPKKNYVNVHSNVYRNISKLQSSMWQLYVHSVLCARPPEANLKYIFVSSFCPPSSRRGSACHTFFESARPIQQALELP